MNEQNGNGKSMNFPRNVQSVLHTMTEGALAGVQGCTAPPYFEIDCNAPPNFKDYIKHVSQMGV